MHLLAVEHLTKSYDKTVAVRDVSFSIEQGRCVALIGPNGAGKTTTVKILAGLIRPTEGTIHLHGEARICVSP